MKTITLFLLFFHVTLLLPAQSGSVTNVLVSQRSDGSGLVDVYFDLAGPPTSYHVYLRVSFNNGGNYFPVSTYSISGDTGPVNPGINKHIV